MILDLGKGDELPSIFAALVPEAQRVIVAPHELDATLQPGVNAARDGMSFIAALKMAYLKHVLRCFFVFFSKIDGSNLRTFMAMLGSQTIAQI